MTAERTPVFTPLHDGLDVYRNGLGNGVQLDVHLEPPLIPGDLLPSALAGTDNLKNSGNNLALGLMSFSTNSSVVRVEAYHRGSSDNARVASRLALNALGRLKRYHAAMNNPRQLGVLIQEFKNEPLGTEHQNGE